MFASQKFKRRPEWTRPTLVLFCGLPGSGKTTMAKKIAAETGAVRLCPDDWMADLGIDMFDEKVRDNLEKRLWKLAQELLLLGHDVIVENGLWPRVERDEKRHDVEHLSVDTEMHYMDVPFEELLRRLEIRNAKAAHGSVVLTREHMETYLPLFQAPDAEELALYTRAVVHRSERRA